MAPAIGARFGASGTYRRLVKRDPRTVAVVGAGVAGLVAARRLARGGARVVVWEADRLGGQVHSLQIAPGTHLDVGAEALHLSAPGVAALVEELGLTETMICAGPGESRLLTRRGLRRLPAGVGPAGPTRLGPVVRSRTLSLAGLARAGLEPVVARRMPTLPDGGDVSVGEFVSDRFGPAVARTFVDPLLGNLHAGDVSRLSLRACSPALLPAATDGRSLVLRRRTRSAAPLSFVTWPEGLSALTSRLLADCSTVEVRPGEAVTSIGRTADGGLQVVTPAGAEPVDAVVLGVPARVASRLLVELAPEPARALGTIEYADVATVLVGVPARAARAGLPGTGLLVPGDSGRLLKAATYLGHKWPHLAGGDTCWLRLSAGRAGDARLGHLSDDDLVAGLLADLRAITGFAAAPTAVVVRRWPAALPQLTVGHHARLGRARAGLPDGVVLAGASYDGLGLASGIRSGTAAAAALAGPQEDS